jgi:hypothetical protein
MENIINFNLEISRTHAIHDFDIDCNNFSKIYRLALDDGRIRPNHAVRKKGD